MSLLVTPFLMQACRHILPDVEGSPVQARCRPLALACQSCACHLLRCGDVLHGCVCCHGEGPCCTRWAHTLMRRLTLKQ